MTHKKVNFIGIGAYKSGTTWISESLREHPEVCIPKIKEIEFFNKRVTKKGDLKYWNYKKGLDWYYNHFKFCNRDQIRGEYSNAYLCDKDTPKLIKKHFPDIKLLVCLRNPLNRAYSHYWWEKNNFNNYMDSSFEEVLNKSNNKILKNSLYYKHLEKYYKEFSEDRILVLLLDDIKNRPIKSFKKLCSFLEIDDTFVPSIIDKKVNPSSVSRFNILTLVFKFKEWLEKRGFGVIVDFLKNAGIYNYLQDFYVLINRRNYKYPSLSEKEKRRLQKIFRKDIDKLEGLISRDLSLWK